VVSDRTEAMLDILSAALRTRTDAHQSDEVVERMRRLGQYMQEINSHAHDADDATSRLASFSHDALTSRYAPTQRRTMQETSANAMYNLIMCFPRYGGNVNFPLEILNRIIHKSFDESLYLTHPANETSLSYCADIFNIVLVQLQKVESKYGMRVVLDAVSIWKQSNDYQDICCRIAHLLNVQEAEEWCRKH